MDNIINLGLLAVMGFFVVFGFLFGFIRGLKKTTFRTIWLALSMVILLLVTPLITTALIDMPINVSVDMPELNIDTISTIRDTINVILTNAIGVDMIAKYPVLADIILSLPQIILNLVLFILLFFVTKILLLPLSAVIFAIFFADKKVKPVKNPDGTVTKPKKKSKHRFIGSLVGVTTGVVVSFAILMPVVAISDMLSKHDMGKAIEESTNNPIIREYTDAYEKSIVATIYNYTGLTFVSNTAFDYLTTVNVDGKQIKYSQDIQSLFTTYAKTMSVLNKSKEYMGDSFDFSKLTKTQLAEILDLTTEILDAAQDVSFVSSVNDILIPLVMDFLEAKDIKLSEDADINAAIVDTLDDLCSSITVDGRSINIFGELNALVDIARYLNNCDMLIPMLSLNNEALATSITALEDDFATTLTNKLFALQTIDVTAPNLINLGLTVLNKSLDIAYDDSHVVTTTTIKNTLASIIDNGLDVYTSLDFDKPEVYTSTTFAAVGRLLDTVKDSTILATDTYNGLIDCAFDFIKDFAQDMVPEDYTNVCNKIFETLPTTVKAVDSWENDLKTVYSAMELMTGENGILGGSFDAKNTEHMTTLGKTLDILASTKLLGTKVNLTYEEDSVNHITQVPFISYILYEGINDLRPLLNKDLEGSDYADLLDVLGDVQSNIIALNYNPTTDTTFFEDDFTKLAPMVKLVLDTMEGTEIDIDASTGEALDKVKQTNLIGNEATIKLVSKLIDIVSTSINLGDADINATIEEVLADVQLRLKSSTLKAFIAEDDTYWMTEMTHIHSLMNIEFSGADALDSISTTGATIDTIVRGNLPTTRPSTLLQSSDFRKIIATTIESLTDSILQNLTSGTAQYNAVNNAITSIVANYNDNTITINSFEAELTHLKAMKDVNPDVFGSADSSNASALGATLDSIAYNTDTTLNSVTITKSIINKIILDCMDLISTAGSPEYVATAINSIKANVNQVYTEAITINSWQQELVQLYDISNVEDILVTDIDALDYDSAQDIGGTLDNLAYNYSSSHNKDTASNSKIVTASILSTLMTDLVEELKVDEATASSTEKLTNKILDNIADPNTIAYTDNEAQSYLYTDIFTDVVYIKAQMDSIKDTVNTPDISTIDGDTATKIDQTLNNIQAKKVAGVVTTREIALEILDSIADSTYRLTAEYATNLYNYYNANITSTTSENYYDSTDTTYDYTTTPLNYTNGFRKVYEEFNDKIGG